MASKARSRQRKTKPAGRHYGKLFLLLLVVASLAGVGYVVFLQGQIFTPPAPEEATEAPPAAQPPEEPLATPPSDAAPQATPPTSPATTAAVEQIPPPVAAPVSEPRATPEVSKPAATLPPSPVLPKEPPATQTTAPKTTPAAKAPAPPAAQPKSGKKPLVAIIIDDMGYQPAIGRKMVELPLNLSFSFLPSGPQTRELAASIKAKGRDILLHLPLEATDRKIDPGPGTLTVAMTPEEMEKQFAEDLAAVPMAIGLNNHMGSRFTEDRAAMAALLGAVKKRNLFFLDSRTSTRSIACAVAREQGVPCLGRQLFLDNEQETDAIMKQIDKLLALAAKNGQAVGIGHPHQATLDALRRSQQKLSEQAEMVGIHRLIR
jgi:polysaccharide deacetylase 2 family uncharacterized protein YibQ